MNQFSIKEGRNLQQAGVSLAEIISANGWGSALCSVYNQSDHGAMLGVPAGYKFPKEFSLRRIATNDARPARLVWEKYGLAGIEFIDRWAKPAASSS